MVKGVRFALLKGSVEETTSKFIHVIDLIQFFVFLRVRFLFLYSCQTGAGFCSQRLPFLHYAFHVASSDSGGMSPTNTWNLSNFSQIKFFAFKDSCDQIQPMEIIQYDLSVTLITTAKPLCHVIYSQIPGTKAWTSLGEGAFCLPKSFI